MTITNERLIGIQSAARCSDDLETAALCSLALGDDHYSCIAWLENNTALLAPTRQQLAGLTTASARNLCAAFWPAPH